MPKDILRSHQNHSGHLLREAFASGLTRVILYGATGSGKTITAIAIIKNAIRQGRTVDFVVNRTQLLDQTSQVFRAFGIQHGILQGENTVESEGQVCICSVDTLQRRDHRKADLLIVDECHWSVGRKIYRELFAGRRVIGLTASPYHPGLGQIVPSLGGPLFETVLIPDGSRITQLQDAGLLVRATWIAFRAPDLSDVHIRKREGVEDYDSDEQAEKFTLLSGDVIEAWARRCADRKTMVFNCNVMHSKHMTEQFNRMGVRAEHVDCYMSEGEKKSIYARFKSGEIQVLNNCVLVGEGSDFPDCSCIVLNRSTKSPTRLDQWIGRGLRIAEGKSDLIIHDHGENYELGFPWEREIAILDPKEIKAKKKKTTFKCKRCDLVRSVKDKRKPCEHCGHKEDVITYDCLQCGFGKERRYDPCPDCGFVPPIPTCVKYVDGEEVVIDSAKKLTLKDQILLMDDKDVWNQLKRIELDRKYKRGWAFINYLTIYGSKPRGLPEYDAEPSEALLKFVRHQQVKKAYAMGRRRK